MDTLNDRRTHQRQIEDQILASCSQFQRPLTAYERNMQDRILANLEWEFASRLDPEETKIDR